MATVSIRYTQFDVIAREVGRQAAVDITRDAVRATALDAQVGVPVRTGDLSSSQYQDVQRAPDSAIGIVGYRADHAASVHEGTRRHPIRPRDPNGWLKFRYKGKIIFAKEVDHGPTQGNPWLFNALTREARPRGFRVVRL